MALANMNKHTFSQLCMLFVTLLLLTTCQNSVVLVPLTDDGVVPDGDVEEEQDKIFLVDQTGKKWDITHAVNKYGFDPDRFMFGLGPNAIKPILKPQMLSPGDTGYPEDGAGFTVLGTSFNGLPRAYSLTVMSRHEIVDEVFGDAHVAVAY